jgi:energy-coupling factor transporter ATP-binding protein EcfA2
MGVIINFLTDLVQSIIIEKGIKNINLNKVKIQLFLRYKYFKVLERLLNEMPFIYKDFDSEVLPDFQHVEAKKIKVMQLKVLNYDHRDQLTKFNEFAEWFKMEKKILVLGDPGVGKSTLMRYIVLSIVKRRKTKYLNYDGNTIPIFIQLKTIMGNVKSPIINYLYNEIVLYKGKKGIKRLEKHLTQRRLIFILDGYDEVSFIGGDNYLQYELGLFFSTNITSEKVDWNKVDRECYHLYKLISDAKVILTSRGEFYRLNPLVDFGSSTYGLSFASFAVPSFSALQLQGLGNLRFNFVNNIFIKQKRKGSIYMEKLDAELFIAEIDLLEDEELKKLSSVPLFLTIMTYLYVSQIRDGKPTKNIWDTTIDKLIEECISTLLKDIDQFKVRSLTDAQKQAFEKRRNDYFIEKNRFLEYFSYTLLFEQRPVFDSDYLKEKVLFYFNNLYISDNSNKIIIGHQRNRNSNPSFTEQLLYSGVFIVVGTLEGKVNYDFPHRRCKEVLAISYLNTIEEPFVVEKLLRNKHATEFFVYYFRQSNKKVKEKIILEVFQSFTKFNSDYAGNLLAESIEERDLHQFCNLFYSELKAWITNNIRVKIPKSLFQKFKPSKIMEQDLIEQLKYVRENNFDSLNLILSVLYEFLGKRFSLVLKLSAGILNGSLIGGVLLAKFRYLYFANYIEEKLHYRYSQSTKKTKDKETFMNPHFFLRKVRLLNDIEKGLLFSSFRNNKYSFIENQILNEVSKVDSKSGRRQEKKGNNILKLVFLIGSFRSEPLRKNRIVTDGLISTFFCDIAEYFVSNMPFDNESFIDALEKLENQNKDKNISTTHKKYLSDIYPEYLYTISDIKRKGTLKNGFFTKFMKLSIQDIYALEDIFP